MSSNTDRLVLSVGDVLELLGGSVSRGTLYKAIRAGELPHVRIGRRILVPQKRLLTWLEGAQQPGAEAGRDRA